MKGLSALTVVTLTVLVGLGSMSASQLPQRPRFQQETTLEKGVDQFNAYVRSFEERGVGIGINEPPLTEEEVIAAILGWDTKRFPVEPEMLRRYQQIAETHMLPAGSELSFTTRWTGFNGRVFDVWWIDLSLPAKEHDKDIPAKIPLPGYTYRIRARMIRSRPMTEQEKKQAERRIIKLMPPEKKTDKPK